MGTFAHRLTTRRHESKKGKKKKGWAARLSRLVRKNASARVYFSQVLRKTGKKKEQANVETV
jgi:hypothetical protein